MQDGSILARQGEIEGLRGSNLCARCGRDPDIAHDRAFCPAFADYREAGRWMPMSVIRAALERAARTPIILKESSRVEEHDGPAGKWHYVVGFYNGNQFLSRFDGPQMPEFSIFEPALESYDPDHGKRAVPSSHNMIYKGWRCALREACAKLRLPRRKVERALGIDLSRSTEEILRFKSGYL